LKVAGIHHRTIWLATDARSVEIIDQTALPAEFRVVRLESLEDAARAIRTMQVRGAPLIGVTAAYGLCLALRADRSAAALAAARATLLATRPTAVNLSWALDRMVAAVESVPPGEAVATAYRLAADLADEDATICERIGVVGAPVLRALWERKGGSVPLQVLTHCNAGWLATVDWGTALAPVYRLHDEGVPVHVWVSETRPRNQGYLTAWELGQHGVPYTVVVDSAAGLLMRQGRVDLCVVGSDRTTRQGDVANKIGTYLKALGAHDSGVPFYVAVPSPSIDWTMVEGDPMPIEERSPEEICGRAGVPVHNPGFDVTPARLVTGLITERGVCAASTEGLLELFPERR
jgi:methylthioribose-1-phosphate isomerase